MRLGVDPRVALGVEAMGTVTHEDYRKILIPAAEAKMAGGPIKMLFIAGSEFSGYALEALWDDAAFGFKHWQQFRRIAVVTESGWLRAAVTMFSPFFLSHVRLFKPGELNAAKEWLNRDDKGGL